MASFAIYSLTKKKFLYQTYWGRSEDTTFAGHLNKCPRYYKVVIKITLSAGHGLCSVERAQVAVQVMRQKCRFQK